MGFAMFAFLFVFIFIILLISRSVKSVKRDTVVIIERLGRPHKVFHAGVHMIVPFIDAPKKVLWRSCGQMKEIDFISLKETVFEYNERLITKDNNIASVRFLIYLQVEDPYKAVYSVTSVPDALDKATREIMRASAADYNMEDLPACRYEINKSLENKLYDTAVEWGIKITRAEVQQIEKTEN